jgi:precorrin-8X/cobalt-precorrin-8 methylmutase
MKELPIGPKASETPLVRALYACPMSGEAIEAESLRTIDTEAGDHHFSADQWHVVRRMIHTTADFSLMEQVRFSSDAIDAGTEALRNGRSLYVDSNMIRSGLSLARLRQVCDSYGPDRLLCHVADSDVADQAREQHLPRSLFAVRKAAGILDGAIAVFGNAPVALLELNRLIVEEGLRPALVVAMPVGFVHVVESKEELMGLGVPFIAIAGRRGGSPLAVAAIHALCTLALTKG